jgi:hypothetical protein
MWIIISVTACGLVSIPSSGMAKQERGIFLLREQRQFIYGRFAAGWKWFDGEKMHCPRICLPVLLFELVTSTTTGCVDSWLRGLYPPPQRFPI